MKPRNNRLLSSYTDVPFIPIVVICCGLTAPVFATTWEGDVSSNWNDPLNWSGDAGTAGTSAIINTSLANVATISATVTGPPSDIIIGDGAAANGRLNHTAGSAATGAGNWLFVGRNGGQGTYNLADTSVMDPGVSGFGTGSGSMNVGGRLYVGGFAGAGSTGVVNVNTSGTLVIGNHLEIGTNASTGTFNLQGGIVIAGSAGGDASVDVGNGAGSTGYFNMSGGSFTKTGALNMIIGGNGSTGIANISGGTLSVNNELWVGNNTGSKGTLNLSGGEISSSSWVVIGRAGATQGTVNMTGGTWTKTNAATAFIVGDRGTGTLLQTNGIINVQEGDTWIGFDGSANLTLNSNADFRANTVQVARNTSSVGVVNLDGGTLKANRIIGGAGTEDVRFNGTEIIAKVDQVDFISGLQTATIGVGGLKINSQAFNVSTAQDFSGSGGLTKTGSGTLTISGLNIATGAALVSAGTLLVNGSLGATTTAVSSGATIGGSGGTIAGSVIIDAGGKLAAGNSIGMLTLGSATIAGTMVVEYDGTGGGTIDLVNSIGALDISAATVDFQMLGAPANDGYYIFAKYGSLVGSGFAVVNNLPASYSIDYAFYDGISSNNIALVVPEPSSVALMGSLGALGLLRRRRK